MKASSTATRAAGRHARLGAGIRVEQVAQVCGTYSMPRMNGSPAAGTREAGPHELARLAGIYRASLSELLRPTPPPAAIGARFRAVMPAGQRDTDDLSSAVDELQRRADLPTGTVALIRGYCEAQALDHAHVSDLLQRISSRASFQAPRGRGGSTARACSRV